MQSHLLIFLLVAVVCNARTVLWTAAGGNPLWNNAGNWDCLCIPTSADDVVIDLQAIPSNVQIGGVVAPALCNSLTIGGTSRFPQTLVVTGALNIGAGGGVLNSNGVIDIETSPNTPVWTSGHFVSRGGKFIFATGSLTGPGTFGFPQGTLLNFTGPASKQISANVQVAGSAIVSSPIGTALQITKGGQLIIDGTFKSPSSLTLSADNNSSFYVNKGAFSFTGFQLSIQGNVILNSWSLGPHSSTTLINSVTSGFLELSAGANLTLIGAPTDKRMFQSITGGGVIRIQGGANVFNTVEAGILEATGGTATFIDVNVGTFILAGSTISGGAPTNLGGTLSALNSFLRTGTIQGGLNLFAGYLTLTGVVNVNDDGTFISINGGQIISSSQITLTGGSSFLLAPGHVLTQTADMKFVQGPPSKKSPTIVVSGWWSNTGNLAIFSIPVSGTGIFTVLPAGSWSLTNVAFNAASVTVQGSVILSQGAFNVSTVNGDGTISGSPASFSTKNLDIRVFALNDGLVTIQNGTVSSLTVSGGSFSVTDTMNFGTFVFAAGSVNGPRTNPAKLNVISTVIKGTTTTLNNVILTTGSLSLNCGGGMCQFFTNNAVVKTQ